MLSSCRNLQPGSAFGPFIISAPLHLWALVAVRHQKRDVTSRLGERQPPARTMHTYHSDDSTSSALTVVVQVAGVALTMAGLDLKHLKMKAWDVRGVRGKRSLG